MMAKNKMREVAKLLGVGFKKEFNIKGSKYNPYKINNIGLISHIGVKEDGTLLCLLKGKFEIEKPVLTNKEKAYLENVLKPFRNKISGLIKKESGRGGCFIAIYFTNGKIMVFPEFYEKEICKGMELNKKYSLEELRLFRNE